MRTGSRASRPESRLSAASPGKDRDGKYQRIQFRIRAEDACRDADLILTHNADGDYGHIHHKVVHEAVSKMATEQVYFASTFNYNTRYIAKDNLPLDQFPLHRDVIEQFSDINCGLYIEQK